MFQKSHFSKFFYTCSKLHICEPSPVLIFTLTKQFDCARVTSTILQASGPKTFSCFTQLNIKFIMLINVKMPITIVGILAFISLVNTTPEG